MDCRQKPRWKSMVNLRSRAVPKAILATCLVVLRRESLEIHRQPGQNHRYHRVTAAMLGEAEFRSSEEMSCVSAVLNETHDPHRNQIGLRASWYFSPRGFPDFGPAGYEQTGDAK